MCFTVEDAKNHTLFTSTGISIYRLGDLREKISRERSGQSVSLLNHLKQGLLP